MTDKPILSIRARLVVLALLVIGPLLLDRVRLLEQTRIERIDDAANEALDLARRGAEGQREVIASARASTQIMARAYVAMLARGDTCNFYLSDLVQTMPWLDGMVLAGPDGRVVCSTRPEGLGVDLSDRVHLKAAQSSGEFVVGDYIVGRFSDRPMIAVAYPTQAIDPNTRATVMAALNLQWLASLVRETERRPGASAMLIDGDGTVLATDARGSDWVGKHVYAELIQRIGTRAEGTERGAGLDGVRRIFGFVRLPFSNAHLLVGLNEAEILRRTDWELAVAYLQLGFFALLLLLIAWIGGDRLIVKPLQSLTRTAERFGRGDFRARAPRESWAKEFRPLTAALNDMAQRLAEREGELRDANKHLAELASSDALSGLANRRGFDARLGAEWQRAGKLRRPVGLVMVDVDHFKLFNDRYGHVEGDVCLRKIGKLLKEVAVGEDDLSARYGGEEFALLLPGADVDAALAAGERLRQRVEALCIAHASSPCGQVTVSVGAASLVPGVAEVSERLIEAADLALYAAKHRGRNTVVTHSAVELAEAS